MFQPGTIMNFPAYCADVFTVRRNNSLNIACIIYTLKLILFLGKGSVRIYFVNFFLIVCLPKRMMLMPFSGLIR